MIKAILDKLKASERDRLQFAFENDMSQYIDLGNGRFVGVNCRAIPTLNVEHEEGLWSIGTIREVLVCR